MRDPRTAAGPPCRRRSRCTRATGNWSEVEGWPTLGVGDLAPQKLPYRLVVETKGDAEVSPYSSSHRRPSGASPPAPRGRCRPSRWSSWTTGRTWTPRAGRSARRTSPSRPWCSAATPPRTRSPRSCSRSPTTTGPAWQRQRLKEKKGIWQASLSAPRRAGYVSIRVTAKQRNGGGVTQTVTRAFGLK